MIDLQEYRHPREKILFGQVMDNKTVQQLFDWCQKEQLDLPYQYVYESSCLKVTCSSFPYLRGLLDKACDEFGIKRVSHCYLMHDYDARVELRGLLEPIILVSEDYVDTAEEVCLYGALAGQVGAIAAGHHLGLGLEWLLAACSEILPVSPKLLIVVNALVNEWKRCRWLTCDRATLLATQNCTKTLEGILDRKVPRPILNLMQLGSVNDAYLAQCNRFFQPNVDAKVAEAVNSIMMDTAWDPLRYKELHSFYMARVRRLETGDEPC